MTRLISSEQKEEFLLNEDVSELREGEGARADTSRGYVRKRQAIREALALPYVA